MNLLEKRYRNLALLVVAVIVLALAWLLFFSVSFESKLSEIDAVWKENGLSVAGFPYRNSQEFDALSLQEIESLKERLGRVEPARIESVEQFVALNKKLLALATARKLLEEKVLAIESTAGICSELSLLDELLEAQREVNEKSKSFVGSYNLFVESFPREAETASLPQIEDNGLELEFLLAQQEENAAAVRGECA